MTENEVVNFLSNVKGCQFATITYKSEVTGVKKIAKEYDITAPIIKICTMQVQFNYSYENAVNNRLEAIGCDSNFKASELPNNQRWLHPNKVIQSADGNTLYVRFYSYKNGQCKTSYFADGLPINEDLRKAIETHKKALQKDSAKQSASGLNDNQVKPFAPKISNILSIKIDGVEIEIVH